MEEKIGKRSEFERAPRDFYSTPEGAFKPIAKYFNEGLIFCEPCAGDGRLIGHIERWVVGSLCAFAMDIEPKQAHILEGDSINIPAEGLDGCDCIITNPPYTWSVLSNMMDVWIPLIPTVLLLPADYMHNVRFAKYLKHCTLIQTVGRVKWIEGSTMSGKDNYAWYFFTPKAPKGTIFKGRE